MRTNPLSSQNPIYPHFLVLIIVLGTHGPRQKLTFGFKVMEIIIIYINLLLCLIKANYITWFTMARQLETSWNPERRATISTACRTSRAFSGSIFGSSPSGSTAPDKLYASVATATIWPQAPARKTCKNRDNRLNVWRTVSLMNMGAMTKILSTTLISASSTPTKQSVYWTFRTRPQTPQAASLHTSYRTQRATNTTTSAWTQATSPATKPTRTVQSN